MTKNTRYINCPICNHTIDLHRDSECTICLLKVEDININGTEDKNSGVLRSLKGE